MEIIQKYIAFDNEEFDTKEECEEYEKIYSIKDNKDIVCLNDTMDGCFEIIKEEIASEYIYADYVYIKTKDAMDLFKLVSDYYGETIEGLNNAGCYKHNNDINEWENIDDIITKYQNLKDRIESVGENINE